MVWCGAVWHGMAWYIVQIVFGAVFNTALELNMYLLKWETSETDNMVDSLKPDL